MENIDLTKEQLIEQIKSQQEKINNLEKAISAQSQDKDALKTSENNLSAISEMNADGILIVDAVGTVLYVNPAAVKLFGRSKEDFMGYPFGFPVSGDKELDFLTIKKGETLCEVELRIVQITWKSRGAFQLSLRDITERKKADDAIKLSNQLLNNALEIGNLAWWEMNCQTGEVLFHERKATMLGYIHENFKHYTDFIALIHPEDFQLAMDAMSDHLQGKKDLYEINYRIKTVTGDYYWYHDIGRITKRDEDGKPLKVMGMVMNITDREKALVKLAQSEERFRVAFENAGLGMTLVDIQGRLIKSNQALRSILGYSEDELLNMDFTQFTHPEDIALDLQLYTELIQDKREQYKIQKRYLHKDGNVVWGKLTVSLIRDSSSMPLYAIGMMENITESRRTDEALQKSEAKHKSMIANIGDVIGIIGSDGLLKYITPNIERWFGWKPEDMIGTIGWEKIHPEDNERIQQEFYTLLEKDNALKTVELRYKCKDDSYKWVELTAVNNINNPAINGLLLNFHDIGERKHFEEQILEQKRYFEQVFSQSSVSTQILDKDGWCEKINPRLSEIFGVKPEDIEGKVYNIFKDESIQRGGILPLLDKVFYEGKSVKWDINFDIGLAADSQNIQVADKKKVWFHNWAYPIFNDEGHLIHVIIQHSDITDRKRAEEAMQKSEVRLRTLLQTIPDLIWLKDRNGVYLSCNTMFERFFDAKEADIIGKTDYDFVNRELADFFRDHDRKAMTAEKPTSNEEWLTFADDGHCALMDTVKMPMCDSEGMLIGVLGISRDITELKKAKETLIRLNQAIENSKEVVFMTDKEGIFTFVNPRFTEMYGFTSEEVLEKETPRILKSDNYTKEDIEQFWNTILNKQNLSLLQYVNRCKDGRLIDVEASTNPILDEQGEIIGFLAVQRDITQRKLSEIELIKAKEKAEESDRLKTAFLTNMSHEIRTPMNGILGFTELLKEPALSIDDQQNYIQYIQISGARMLNTINNIINISKIESGLVRIDIKETNINEKVEFIYNFFKPEIEIKNLKFSFKNGLQSKESIIKTDNEKVYGILTNLVKNAIKFTEEGSIEFGYVKKGGYLEFFVKDTGIGINHKKTEIIFERFRQGSESHNRGYEGSGLGLSITKSYVNMLGGEIWVESEEGKGSTFYFTIPYDAASEEKSIKGNTFSEKEKEFQLKKLKILIVDDDDVSHILLTRMLKNISCEVLYAITGTEAIEVCRTNPDIDLILMDVRMQNMNGNEATRQIRQFNKDVIIIAQTAHAFDGDKENALEAGCNSYITKPINRTILTDLITSYFN